MPNGLEEIGCVHVRGRSAIGHESVNVARQFICRDIDIHVNVSGHILLTLLEEASPTAMPLAPTMSIRLAMYWPLRYVFSIRW